MNGDEQAANDAERWFERYLRDHGYEYEPDPRDPNEPGLPHHAQRQRRDL